LGELAGAVGAALCARDQFGAPATGLAASRSISGS
jgi:hypothetical protein